MSVLEACASGDLPWWVGVAVLVLRAAPAGALLVVRLVRGSC